MPKATTGGASNAWEEAEAVELEAVDALIDVVAEALAAVEADADVPDAPQDDEPASVTVTADDGAQNGAVADDETEA